MCIRVQFTPRDQLDEPWDADRQLITLPAELTGEYASRALHTVLAQLDIEQGEFGARCWCGELVSLLPVIPQQRRSDEVIHLGA